MIITAVLTLLASTATSCGDDEPAGVPPQAIVPGGGDGLQDYDDGQNDENMTDKITISVGGTEYSTTLADNETARAFAARLPMTLDMSELNGNEKYYYLDESLPVDACNPGTIRSGDLMLYGSDCLVLFYETFSTSYSYTRIGAIDNPEGLAGAVGGGDATVTFSAAE